ncbi:MAG: hypothetical protein Q7R95_06145 [bacterium]|nr:hypothetical protein [bacterium]
MNDKIHRYIHLFKDKKTVVDVIIDFTEDKIKFSSKIPFTYELDANLQIEYSYWLFNFVHYDVMQRLTQAQIDNLSKEGAKHLKFLI